MDRLGKRNTMATATGVCGAVVVTSEMHVHRLAGFSARVLGFGRSGFVLSGRSNKHLPGSFLLLPEAHLSKK